MTAILIRKAAIHGLPGHHDVVLEGGRVARFAPHHASAPPLDPATLQGDRPPPEVIEARGGLLSRAFVEPHLHPDKSFSLSDLPAAELAGLDPFTRSTRIKSAFTRESVARRARRAFELAVANGVTRLRANIDIDSIAGLRGFEGVLQAREEVAGILDVDLVAFPQEGLTRDPSSYDLLRAALGMGAGLIGGWPNVEADEETQRAHVATVFDLAEEFDVDVDIHADCWIDAKERMLGVIAEETARRCFHGRVMASHCCGIECYGEGARAVAEQVAAADLRVSVIPLNLLDGIGRGLSAPHLLREAGAQVVVGSDNLNDGWYALGTLNPLDRIHMMVMGGGFDDSAVNAVWHMVAGGAAHALDNRSRAESAEEEACDIRPGMLADLVLFSAQSRLEALRNPGGARTTIKGGRIVARRSLDEHFPLRAGTAS